MTALPPTYLTSASGGRDSRWWPVLASLLPANADQELFLHILEIHGDPVATRHRIDEARRRGERFDGPAYTHPRAFSHIPGRDDLQWLRTVFGANGPAGLAVLDPTAGGGSIPFEALRLGVRPFANDLNPVSALIHARDGGVATRPRAGALQDAFEESAGRFVRTREERLAPCCPPEPESNAISTNYLWARTVSCTYFQEPRPAGVVVNAADALGPDEPAAGAGLDGQFDAGAQQLAV